MTVYLDDWRQPAEIRGRVDRWSHLIGDHREELHAFAARFGVSHRAFQDHAWRWHYDVPERLRTAVIGAGAEPIGWRDLGFMLRARRRSIDYPPPATGALFVTAPVDPHAVARVLAMRLAVPYVNADRGPVELPRVRRGSDGIVYAGRARPDGSAAVEVIELTTNRGASDVVEVLVAQWLGRKLRDMTD